MALYDIVKLDVEIQHENGRNAFDVVNQEEVDVTAYANDLLNERKDFIINSMISMGHLTNEASTDNIEIVYHITSLKGIAERIRLQDKRTGYPLLMIVKRTD